jgi:hypothetical protein
MPASHASYPSTTTPYPAASTPLDPCPPPPGFDPATSSSAPAPPAPAAETNTTPWYTSPTTSPAGGVLQSSNHIAVLLASSNRVTLLSGIVQSHHFIAGVVQSRPPLPPGPVLREAFRAFPCVVSSAAAAASGWSSRGEGPHRKQQHRLDEEAHKVTRHWFTIQG